MKLNSSILCIVAWPVIICVMLSLVIFSISPAVAQGLVYRLDAGNNSVLSLDRLYSGQECGLESYSGRVVARNFNQVGTHLESITVELRSGRRIFVNVIIDWDEISDIAKQMTLEGLQTLLRQGRNVSIEVAHCGASGRFTILNGVR